MLVGAALSSAACSRSAKTGEPRCQRSSSQIVASMALKWHRRDTGHVTDEVINHLGDVQALKVAVLEDKRKAKVDNL